MTQAMLIGAAKNATIHAIDSFNFGAPISRFYDAAPQCTNKTPPNHSGGAGRCEVCASTVAMTLSYNSSIGHGRLAAVAAAPESP